MKKSFAITWISQTLVIFSLVLVVFTAGIIVYRETGSLISFSAIILCGYVPELIIMPLAGSFIDRISRKTLLVGCSLSQASLFTFYFLMLMQSASNLNVTYVIIAISSAVAGVQRLTYISSIALFSSNSRTRLNGMVQAGLASAHILAPLVAGFILDYSNNWVIAAIAIIACTASAIAMTFINFPELPKKKNKSESVKADLKQSFRYIKKSPGLLLFLLINSLSSLAQGSVIVLFTPFVLTFSTESILGSLRATAGIGMAIGSFLISFWGRPNNLLRGFIQSLGVSGFFMAVVGVTQTPTIIGFAIFSVFMATPTLMAITHTIWQHQVPVEIQGRVFSVRDTITGAALTIGYVISPLLADFVFIPLSKNPASGLGGTYVVMGLLTIILALFTSRQASLKNLDIIKAN